MTKDKDKDKAEDKDKAKLPFPFFTVEETLETWKSICGPSLNFFRSLYPTSKLKDDKKDEEKDRNG